MSQVRSVHLRTGYRNSPVERDRHAIDLSLVPFERSKHLSVGCVEQTERSIGRTRKDVPPVGADGHRAHQTVMSTACGDDPFLGDI
jgi:hypothetical protein